jgi:hypothetical protein
MLVTCWALPQFNGIVRFCQFGRVFAPMGVLVFGEEDPDALGSLHDAASSFE